MLKHHQQVELSGALLTAADYWADARGSERPEGLHTEQREISGQGVGVLS